jgi:hypothetical protein
MKKVICYLDFFSCVVLLCSCGDHGVSAVSQPIVNNPVVNTNAIFVSPTGNDHNKGTIDSPIASFAHAQDIASPGDTVYFRGGTYKVNAYTDIQESLYACIFDLTKSGTESKPICYFGYPGERPVFDFSNVKPVGYRVAGFYIHADYLHLKNFDVIGTQVTITTHTQSEGVTIRRGNHDNVIEDIAVHDGMGIGFYVTKGSNNLFLNCDAYNNYDCVSEGGIGGNTDGFGCHVRAEDTGNVFRGCRAWCNSDDGYDCINNYASVVFDHCWSFYNGYKNFSNLSEGDGNGFKGGGYGLRALPAEIKAPVNTIENCIAYHNKANGFYANHHLNGDDWYNNTACYNKYNFCMVNQKSWDDAVDVDGYDHVLVNNIALSGVKGNFTQIDQTKCTIVNNSFLPYDYSPSSGDFENTTDYQQLTGPRKADGSLPDLTFLLLKKSSPLYNKQMGYQFDFKSTDYAKGILP